MKELALSRDQTDVVGLVDSVLAEHGGTELTDDLDTLAAARRALVDAGIWSLGIAEDLGGGGASLDLRLTAFAALGRQWPALALASAHAHAAAELLGDMYQEIAKRVVAGEISACVLERGTSDTGLRRSDERVVGQIVRLDPAGDQIHLLLIDDDGTLLLLPSALTIAEPLARSGLAGARTTRAMIGATVGEDAFVLSGSAGRDVCNKLLLAGAAIAAGLSLEAANRSLEYSRARVQFGAPLTALPTVRQALFDQATIARQAFFRALGTDPSSRVLTAAALQQACDNAIDIAASSIQSHGGYGYLAEYGVERLLRDAVSLRAATCSVGHARTAAAEHSAGRAGR